MAFFYWPRSNDLIQKHIEQNERKMKSDEEIKMLNAKAYQNGFRDGMSLDHKNPQTFTFMGYDMDKLSEVIFEYEKKFEYSQEWTPEQANRMLNRGDFIPNLYSKEKKMTRDFNTIVENLAMFYNRNDAACLLGALEALGLIKFDEPSPIERETIKLSKFADDIGYMGSINGLLGLAEKHGLSIKEDNPK